MLVLTMQKEYGLSMGELQLILHSGIRYSRFSPMQETLDHTWELLLLFILLQDFILVKNGLHGFIEV